MNKLAKKVLFYALVLSLATGMTSTSSAQGNITKEETVYVTLHEDGKVRDIYVVNAFELDEAGMITDYGNYSEVCNMSTTDKFGHTMESTGAWEYLFQYMVLFNFSRYKAFPFA